MIHFSQRVKEAIKPALAMVIAYGISLGMGWENPYWAGFAVAMISMSTVGQSLNKGTMRMLGTLVAATVVILLIAGFAQDRWVFVGIVSVYLGFCAYMFTGRQRTYFWWCCAFVSLVIATHASADMENSFDVAVLRVQQTGLGILVYTLVSVFLWPTDTLDELEADTRKLFSIQARLYKAYRELLNGDGTTEDLDALRMQELQFLGRREQALQAAETDSYPVWELRYQWRRLHHRSTELMEMLEQWRESFTETQSLDLNALLPNLDAVSTELDARFAGIEHMLDGESPLRLPQAVTLAMNIDAIRSLDHFDKAAVTVIKERIDRLEVLTREIFECVSDLEGYDIQFPDPVRKAVGTAGFGLDPDRLELALRVFTATWIAFTTWFYYDPPGHSSYVLVTMIVVMASAMIRISPDMQFKPFMLAAFFAGMVYVFIMPQLSGFLQLGVMLFIGTFLIYYLFSAPQQALSKTIGAAMFLNVIAVQNQQTYDFAALANSVAMIALAVAVSIAIWYLPPSPRPEKKFLRLLTRFFRHSDFLLSRLALDWEEKKSLLDRWKMVYYRADLLSLAQKLSLWGGKIDPRLLPADNPEQVQALVTSLDAFALRVKALAETRDLQQADQLGQALLSDMRAWRLVIQDHLRLWADNPSLVRGRSAEMQERLTARLARLEERFEAVFLEIGEGQLSNRDYENIYRLLGSFRGLSEAGLGYARLAEQVNWARWQEARF